MPRKTNYSLHYDEDYDKYDDYEDYEDYDYDHDIEGNGKLSQAEKMVSKSGLWRCSICGYDNDDSSLHCDICGAIRDPSNNSSSNNNNNRNSSINDNNNNNSSNGALFHKEGINFGSEQKGKLSQPEKMVSHSGLWQCSICGYDNDDSSLHCDTCGAIRDPSNSSSNNNNNNNNNSSSNNNNNNNSSNGALFHKEGANFGSYLEQKASTRASFSSNGKKGLVKYLPDNEMSYCSSASFSNVSCRKESNGSTGRNNGDKSHTLVSDLDNLKLNKSSTKSTKANSHAQYKPEKWMSLEQEQGALSQLNLAIVGHVDSGKSTLSGRLLHLLGRISKKEMHKYEKESKEMGKKSFAYAWAMDESAEERERGVTMTVAVAYFDSKKYHVVLLDSPGHKDFVPNMISGATQADAAVLVVDASVGSFEAGMDGNGVGQTREHAQLIRSFGVEQIIVAVNKMDVVEYSKERFEFIKLQLCSFLRSCGFKESSVTWIPLSAMANQNLATTASDVRLSCWYHGLCLLDAIDSLQPLPRDISKPLRLPICDVTRSHLGQVAASGKLETGAIQNGSKVLILPSRDLATIRSIERDSCACTTATAGDNVVVGLHGIDWDYVMPGGVLCHPDFPVEVADCLELKILVLDTTTPILIGSQVEFHIHHAKVAARVAKIVSLLDPKTGAVAKKPPRFLKSKQSAVIEVALDGAVCVEEFSKCRALGRVFLRSSGNTIAVGVVTRIIKQ